MIGKGIKKAIQSVLGGGFSPRNVSESSIQMAASSSPSTIYLGYDAQNYPGDPAVKAWYNSPFRWVGYYLPAPYYKPTTPWSGHMAYLSGLGYGFGILYVGRQLGDSKLDYATGQADGQDAMTQASKEGFDNNVIYFDVEAGAGSITAAFLDYIDGWLDALDDSSYYYPGIYCSYKTNPQQIQNSRPQMGIQFWVYRLGIIGCTTDIGSHTVADSGASLASSWQYAQGCQNMTINGQTISPVDLDMSNSSDPSAPPP